MANYPESITLPNNGVILEITDNTPINTILSQGFAQAYVRQIGELVDNCAVNDNVYYDATNTLRFKQSTATYVFVTKDRIKFIQTELPTPP